MSLASAYIWRKGQVNVRTTRTGTRRDRHSYETRKGARCATGVVSRGFQLQKTRAGFEEKGKKGTRD